MNKTELLLLISKKTNLPIQKVNEVFCEFKRSVIEIVNKGGEVSLKNFGKFTACETLERIYRNPITKKPFFSSRKKYIKFFAFKNFKFSIK